MGRGATCEDGSLGRAPGCFKGQIRKTSTRNDTNLANFA